MPASNTQISNLSDLPTFDDVRDDGDDGFSVAISKAYTTELRPVIMVTCSSDPGADDSDSFVPTLVIEPELFRSRRTYGERDFLDHEAPLETFLTQLKDERCSALVSHVAATIFGSDMGWNLQGQNRDGTPITRKELRRKRLMFKNNCPTVTRAICTILTTMMMVEKEHTGKDTYPGLRSVLPADWKNLTTEGDKKSIIKPSRASKDSATDGGKIAVTAAARAHEKSNKTVYDAYDVRDIGLETTTRGGNILEE